MIKKKISNFTFAMLIMTMLAIPINISPSYGSDPIEISVIDSKMTQNNTLGVKEKIESLKGKSMDKNIILHEITKVDDINNMDDVIIINKYDALNQRNILSEKANSGKAVYVYGGVSRSEANEIFGIEIFPTPEKDKIVKALRTKKLSERDLEHAVNEELRKTVHRKFDVVGVYTDSNGKTIPYLSDLFVEEGSKTTAKFAASIVNHINKKIQKKNSFISKNVASADTRVDHQLDIGGSYFIGSKEIATMEMDYYLVQDQDETTSDDYFAIEDHMEVETFHGADPVMMKAKHSLPYSVDDLQDWSPGDTSDKQNFSVNLPWGISWNFSTNDDVDVDASGSQSSDTVSWEFTEARFWSSYLHNPERVKPGSAWVSAGESLAAVDIVNTLHFDYQSQIRTWNYSYDYRYYY
ncbi:hypothetical protein [Marinicrinis sediminis]|uniref:Uncharacterized protein n=1 Tax=Marinicrinis sediminis TaxID=1652465 RepID=A0ABW5R8X0_9BACL